MIPGLEPAFALFVALVLLAVAWQPGQRRRM